MIDRVSWKDALKGAFKPYLSSNTPVVITDLYTSHPIMSWNVDRLGAVYGELVIRVLRSTSQYFFYNETVEREIVQMTLSEFLTRAVYAPGADGFYYTLGRSPIDQFEGFSEYMYMPPPFESILRGFLRMPERNIWISPFGTRTALHFDAVENLNIQVEGSKSFLLFPPMIDGMYPCKWTSQAAYVSTVDPRDPSPVPGFPYDAQIEVTLVSGEMLYIPYGWWHQVDTVGHINLNANYWWFPRLKLLSFPQQTLRGAAVLINRKGQHPHKRAQKISNKKEC